MCVVSQKCNILLIWEKVMPNSKTPAAHQPIDRAYHSWGLGYAIQFTVIAIEEHNPGWDTR